MNMLTRMKIMMKAKLMRTLPKLEESDCSVGMEGRRLASVEDRYEERRPKSSPGRESSILSLSLSWFWRESVEDRRLLRLVLTVCTVSPPSVIERVVICWELCVVRSELPRAAESLGPGLSVTDLRSWRQQMCVTRHDCHQLTCLRLASILS